MSLTKRNQKTSSGSRKTSTAKTRLQKLKARTESSRDHVVGSGQYSEAGFRDVRTNYEKDRLLQWADAYHANGRLPLSDIVTPPSTISGADVVTNTPLPRTPSAKLEINYLHHHIVTFSPDDDSKDSTAAFKQSITSTIFSNTAGQLRQNPQVDRNDSHSPPPQTVKSISVNGRTIRFTAETLPEPPMLTYKTKGDLEQLVRDWIGGTLITMDGLGIPLGLWKKLYKRTRPPAWTRLKDQWTKFKFIVGGFKNFENAEEFWTAMSLEPTTPESKIVSFRKISATLRGIRNERDKEYAETAKRKYNDKEYGALFSYKKNGEVHLVTNVQDIARRYRLENREVVYWDEEETDKE